MFNPKKKFQNLKSEKKSVAHVFQGLFTKSFQTCFHIQWTMASMPMRWKITRSVASAVVCVQLVCDANVFWLSFSDNSIRIAKTQHQLITRIHGRNKASRACVGKYSVPQHSKGWLVVQIWQFGHPRFAQQWLYLHFNVLMMLMFMNLAFCVGTHRPENCNGRVSTKNGTSPKTVAASWGIELFCCSENAVYVS